MKQKLFYLLLMGLVMLATKSVSAGPLDVMINPGELTRAHAGLEKDCKNCHKPFSKGHQDRLCVSCHDHEAIAADLGRHTGFHGHTRGKECRECHTEHKGRKSNIVHLDKRTFDHALTDFPLKGRHASAKVACKQCHKPSVKFRDAPSDCFSCHQKDDAHKGALGRDCASCHVADEWKQVRFDHNKTDYPLIGKHLDVKCNACHKTSNHKATPKTCVACHRGDDEHRGRFGTNCKTCHTARGWGINLFDHGRSTRYPLRGAHRNIACKSCHTGHLYKQKLQTRCISCHQSDDVHKGQEGQQCQLCHSDSRWTQARIDHDLFVFPLLGKHYDLKCKQCHKKPTFKDAPVACYACHKKDDEHKQRLGTRCEQCHNTRGWGYWSFDHNRQTRFMLDGGHKGLRCDACHQRPAGKNISLPSKCSSCHVEDDVHDGKFGDRCERCHVTSDFRRIKSIPGLH